MLLSWPGDHLMPSEKQIAANRANAKKSTGPNTEDGKSISCQNAVKTGLDAKSEVMRCESRPEYDLLIAEYYARFPARHPRKERCLSSTTSHPEPNSASRRYTQFRHAHLGARVLQNRLQLSQPGASSDQSECKRSARAQRCVNQTKRNFALALKQLNTRQAKRAANPDRYYHLGSAARAAREPASGRSFIDPTPAEPAAPGIHGLRSSVQPKRPSPNHRPPAARSSHHNPKSARKSRPQPHK